MLLNIIRWIKGYVDFGVTGKFPERFINLMNINGIGYWDSMPVENGFTAKMLAKDYSNIRSLAKSAGVKIRIKSKKGMPIYINKYKNRKGIPVGVVLSVLIIILLNQFVWVVDINGNEKLSRHEIEPILKKYGLSVGVVKKTVDLKNIEQSVLLEIPDLRWISVNMLNNVATVEVKEKENKPKIMKNYPCNIKAICDGVITKTNIKNGTNQVKVGSAVAENQVLVNSVMTYGEGKIKYVHSDAEIFADVMYEKSFSQNINKKYFYPVNETTRKTNLNFLWFVFPWEVSSSYSTYKINEYNTYRLKINDVELPIGYMRENSYYFEENKHNRNEKEILKTELALYELFNENSSDIKERKLHFTTKQNKINLKASYIVNKDIAQKQKIDIKP